MLRILARYWWLVALRGLLAVAFGILALIWPRQIDRVLILVFGAFAFVEGMISLATLFVAQPGGSQSALLTLQGVLGLSIGLLTAFFTDKVLDVFVVLVGAWAILAGVVEVLAAFQKRQGLTDEWWLILRGLVSIAFGLLALGSLAVGAELIGYLIGFYAMLFGFGLLGLSLRLRHLRQHLHPDTPGKGGSGPVVAGP